MRFHAITFSLLILLCSKDSFAGETFLEGQPADEFILQAIRAGDSIRLRWEYPNNPRDSSIEYIVGPCEYLADIGKEGEAELRDSKYRIPGGYEKSVSSTEFLKFRADVVNRMGAEAFQSAHCWINH